MSDTLKGADQLNLSADGRTATNWRPYAQQLENLLSAREVHGIYLDEVLLNTADGARPPDPGPDQNEWIAQEDGRTAEQYLTAATAYKHWSRANRVTHGLVSTTLPQQLREDCAQHPIVHELWKYLQSRFSAQTLSSLGLLHSKLFTLRLDNFSSVAAFITAVTQIKTEILAFGADWHQHAVAGVILNGMGDSYPATKELLLTLPHEQQIKEVFAQRLIEAEKNADLTNSFQGLVQANGVGTGQGCGYIRKLQGKHPHQAPGQRCSTGKHTRNQCFMLQDDQWLAANPLKTSKDLPNWFDFFKIKKNQKAQDSKAKAHVHNVVVDAAGGCADGSQAVNSACVVKDAVNDADMPAALSGGMADEGFSSGMLMFDDYLQGADSPHLPTIAPAPALSTPALTVTSSPAPVKQVIVVLDSGASKTCLKDGVNKRPLITPLTAAGACKGVSVTALHQVELPCPALKSGTVTGIYSPEFTHNLVSLRELQRQGVKVHFPAYASEAYCKDPDTGNVTWVFKAGSSGLYESMVTTPAAVPVLSVSPAQQQSSMLLHHRLGHMHHAYIKTLIANQAIDGLPKTHAAKGC